MKYEVHISGQPNSRRGERDQQTTRSTSRRPPGMPPTGNRPPQPPPDARQPPPDVRQTPPDAGQTHSLMHRLPPTIQVLTNVPAQVQQRLQTIGGQAFQQGRSLEHICKELYSFVQTLGYEATLGVQEVYSSSMPSFPGQTVTSALILIDVHTTAVSPRTAPMPYGRAS